MIKNFKPQQLHHSGSGYCPAGWLKFRKYDGISAIWIAQDRKLYSITGTDLCAPDWFIEKMPSMSVHGELWNPKEDSSSAVKNNWDELVFIGFAFPNGSWRFSREQAKLQTNEIFQIPEPVESFDSSWEGLVFQNPNILYPHGRTYNVLKWKPTYDDEGIVVGYKGGSLIVRVRITEKYQSIHGYHGWLPEYLDVTVKLNNMAESCSPSKYYGRGTTVKFKFLGIGKNNLLGANR